ncbi:MAG: hypothetical protein C0393_01785, partial [Anaerolinea sp.]|nr:hypothetical protein [Anaerolinea sp.]
ADSVSVRALYSRLTRDGVDAWLDKEKLLPSQDWELEIRKAVREADVVVVCLSKQFNQAGFRQKEVRIALNEADMKPEGEIFIIPARLEECDTLESLRKWHWVDLFDSDGYDYLVRALKTRSENIGVTLHMKRNWLEKVPTPEKKAETAIRASMPNWMFWTRGIVLTLTLLAISYILGTIAADIAFEYFPDDYISFLFAIPTWLVGLAVTVWLGMKGIRKRKRSFCKNGMKHSYFNKTESISSSA